MATCLSIIQSVCKRVGLASPTSAVGNSEVQIANIVELCNEEGQELSVRANWTAQQLEASFTTLAAEDQGLVETIAPGFNFIINDTIWNRTLRRPVFGPRTPQEWQQNKAFAINGPWSNFRIRGGHIYMYPTPAAGQSCYFEYQTRNWLTNSGGTTSYESWNADTDIPLLDWHLLVLGTIWRWKKFKGFEYAEDFATYERRVVDSIAIDGGKDSISMSGAKYDIFPGVVVPSGSWNV